ncbi:MAG: type II secretion system minor pseudopilin GspK [Bermanella sp.]
MPSFANKQKGLALITVLFIFALVSLLAISMQSRQKMSMAQASASISLTQAQLLALSVEDVAKSGLIFDANRDTNADEPWDTSAEQWNQLPPVEWAGANIEVYVRDLQGLFNLNSLSPDGVNPTAAMARFERLIDEVGSKTGILIPSSVATNLKDWLDPNSTASSIYQNMEPPYSASGVPFSHPSELMLIEEVDRDIYIALEPYITALPAKTTLNINTTESMVLKSWDSKLTLADAEKIVNVTRPGACGPSVRNNNVHDSVSDLFANTILDPLVKASAGQNPTGRWDTADFSLNTVYFSVFIKVQIDGQEMILESIIKRDMDPNTGFVGVVYRDFSRKAADIGRLKLISCT